MFTRLIHLFCTSSCAGSVLAFSIVCGLSGAVLAQTGPTVRVSVDSSGGEANGLSLFPSLSADGRFVAFGSYATNLVAEDTNGHRDIFVHDRQTGTTERVSIDSSGVQADGESSFDIASISADGRLVAFASDATNLVAGDTNEVRDGFVHDRQTGITERVSVDSFGAEANAEVSNPSVSADGRFLTFHSTASNLVTEDTNGVEDVFVHDRQTGITERVSIDSSGVEGNGRSATARLSTDGRFVSFHSRASNLVTADTNGVEDVFVHDRQTRITERVLVDVRFAEISGDGRFVAVRGIIVHDRQTGTTESVSVDSSGAETLGSDPSISADGRFVGFESANFTTPFQNVFVHDRQTGITERISVGSLGAETDGFSRTPSFSADGRVIAFVSVATNLVAGDTNEVHDVFVRERFDEDEDADTIRDSIDTQPTIASADFSDVGQGGTTEGTLVARGDQALLSILDSPRAAPNDGVLVATGADQGPFPAMVQTCVGASQVLVHVFSGTRVLMTCGSFTARVDKGGAAITFTVGGEAATASLNAGTGLSYDPSTNLLSTPADSTETIVVTISGNAVPVPPGTTTSVGDGTPPTISAAATVPPNAAGWYAGNVTVHFSCADAGSGIPAGACPADQTLSVEGAAVASAAQTVTDAAGNTSAASNIVVVKIDKTAPTINPSVSPNPVLLNGTATVASGVADALSGVASQSCGATATSSVGAKTVSCTASDHAGNIGSASARYQVIYLWTGFFQPVDNLPVLNQVKAGGAVPVKFRLGGNQGLSIFAAGYPVSRLIACDSSAPLDDIEQTLTAGGSSLSYDPVSGQYSYIWKTEKSGANTCRQVVLKFVDGSERLANFKLR
jgi:Tol biopolymer transport system component